MVKYRYFGYLAILARSGVPAKWVYVQVCIYPGYGMYAYTVIYPFSHIWSNMVILGITQNRSFWGYPEIPVFGVPAKWVYVQVCIYPGYGMYAYTVIYRYIPL